MKKIRYHILKNHKIIACCLLLLAVATIAHAQPPSIGGDVDEVPVDGGLSLLVAAGLGYGIKRMRGNSTGSKQR